MNESFKSWTLVGTLFTVDIEEFSVCMRKCTGINYDFQFLFCGNGPQLSKTSDICVLHRNKGIFPCLGSSSSLALCP